MKPGLQRARAVAVGGTQLIRNSVTAPPQAPEPLVTVILAAYNWSSVLRHAIRSVLDQTHENLELLVVGDACTDDSEAVARSFGDQRVRWDNLPENSGSQSGPNNRGLELARGELIAYQGQDDLWHPYHLATLVNTFATTDADFAWTVAEMLGPPGSRMRTLSGRFWQDQRELGRGVPPCSWMHRRELVARMGEWPDWRQEEQPVDVEMLDRAQRAGARMRAVPALTVFKFPSSVRPNSYRDKPSHEQAEYMRRIRSRRAVRIREVLAAACNQALAAPEAPAGGIPDHRPDGARRDNPANTANPRSGAMIRLAAKRRRPRYRRISTQ